MHKTKLNNIVFIADFEGGDPIAFARVMVREHRLPLSYGYTFSCAASSWLKAQSKESETRKDYEAGAWEQLKLRQLVASAPTNVVGVLGLATGEGLGEIELLRNVLAEGNIVHYLAVDLSPVLLMAHIETIRESFDRELKEGKLLCAGVVGDVFIELASVLETARASLEASGAVKGSEEFLPADAPLLVTYLGNCLGNNSTGCEKQIFTIIAETFPGRRSPLVIVLGVSVMRAEPDYYSPAFSNFLLEIPRYLLKELHVLRSVNSSFSSAPEEFVLTIDKAGYCDRLPPIMPQLFNADGIEGQTYNFAYKLAFALEIPADGMTIRAGTTISLYSVTKFKPATLAKSLQADGFSVIYDPAYHKCIETEFGVREYAVLAAVFPGGPHSDDKTGLRE